MWWSSERSGALFGYVPKNQWVGSKVLCHVMRRMIGSWLRLWRNALFLHQLSALKHRIDAFDDQPDAIAHDLVGLQLDDVEVLAKLG